MKYATLPTLKNPVSRLVYGTFIAPIVDGGAGFEHLDAPQPTMQPTP